MSQLYTNINIDIRKRVFTQRIDIAQGDTSRSIRVTLADSGALYVIPTDSYAVIMGHKSDGTSLFNHCRIEQNAILYDFTPMTTAAVGELPLYIRLYTGGKHLITTVPLQVNVYPLKFTPEDAAASRNEQTALDDLVIRARSLELDLEHQRDTGALNGQSAFDAAKSHGFQGTEQEWLDSLRYDHSDEFKALSDRVATDAETSAAAAQTAKDTVSGIENSAQISSAAAKNAKIYRDAAEQYAGACLESKSEAQQSAAASNTNAGLAAAQAAEARAAADRAENALAQKADKGDIPTSTSQLTNDSGYISIDLGIPSASAGDLLKVRSVDSKGKITALEPTTLEQEEGKWELIEEFTSTELAGFRRDKEPDGTPYRFKAIRLKCVIGEFAEDAFGNSNFGTGGEYVTFRLETPGKPGESWWCECVPFYGFYTAHGTKTPVGDAHEMAVDSICKATRLFNLTADKPLTKIYSLGNWLSVGTVMQIWAVRW